MSEFDIKNDTHRRYNPLTGEWILVSPHRGKRPWQGQQEKPQIPEQIAYDEHCYLCPGNKRDGGVRNPEYTEPFVFLNDFSAIIPTTAEGKIDDEMFRVQSEKGICKVICFSPNHTKTVPQLTLNEAVKVVQVWQQQYRELGAKDFINHIQIFENKGAAMGCSNPHPHCQIWAQQSIPEIVKKEDAQQKAYFEQHKTPLLLDYVAKELQKNERIIAENDTFVALVPFWATWPYEVMIVPKTAKQSLADLNELELCDFAAMYQVVTCKYDNLFDISFPYSAGVHQALTNGANQEHWTMHMHFYPPLFRSAMVRKFMVGYEMLAESQRDLTAEQSADILKELATIHYTLKH